MAPIAGTNCYLPPSWGTLRARQPFSEWQGPCAVGCFSSPQKLEVVVSWRRLDARRVGGSPVCIVQGLLLISWACRGPARNARRAGSSLDAHHRGTLKLHAKEQVNHLGWYEALPSKALHASDESHARSLQARPLRPCLSESAWKRTSAALQTNNVVIEKAIETKNTPRSTAPRGTQSKEPLLSFCEHEQLQQMISNHFKVSA